MILLPPVQMGRLWLVIIIAIQIQVTVHHVFRVVNTMSHLKMMIQMKKKLFIVEMTPAITKKIIILVQKTVQIHAQALVMMTILIHSIIAMKILVTSVLMN